MPAQGGWLHEQPSTPDICSQCLLHAQASSVYILCLKFLCERMGERQNYEIIRVIFTEDSIPFSRIFLFKVPSNCLLSDNSWFTKGFLWFTVTQLATLFNFFPRTSFCGLYFLLCKSRCTLLQCLPWTSEQCLAGMGQTDFKSLPRAISQNQAKHLDCRVQLC